MTKSTTRTKADLQTYAQTDIDAKDVVAKAGRKNLIINGGMQVSQRGDFTSATGTPVGYYLDRFYHEQTTLTTSFQHITTSINGVTKKALRINLTSTGSGEAYVMQRMEDANLQIGATYTFSAWVKSNNTSVGLRFNNGVAWQPVSVTHSGSGNWEHLSAQVTITGLSNTFTCQFLVTSATSGDYFEFTEAQLELGSVATDFEHRSYGEELALCQRYGLRLNQGRLLGGWGNSTSAKVMVNNPVAFRTSPTLVVNVAGSLLRETLSWHPITNFTIDIESQAHNVLLQTLCASSGASQGQVTWAGNGTDIFLDAEL